MIWAQNSTLQVAVALACLSTYCYMAWVTRIYASTESNTAIAEKNFSHGEKMSNSILVSNVSIATSPAVPKTNTTVVNLSAINATKVPETTKATTTEIPLPVVEMKPSPTATSHPIQPYLRGQPVTLILLLSYQRTGSSFIGNLFHYSKNPHVFYIYEPLDPVYTAMYSTDMGWNVPTDMHNFRNGTPRELPEEELAASDMILESIYQCNMSTLPTAMLIHRFWAQFMNQMNTKPYVSCMTSKSVPLATVLDTCRVHIKPICSGRFDGGRLQLELCRDVLYNKGRWTSSAEELVQKLTPAGAEAFDKYFKCLKMYQEPARACAERHFDAPCKTKAIRAVKTVRAGMHTAERLLKRWDHFKVVHSFRDPRGAARSRSLSSWSQGSYEGPVLKKIAHCYCRTVLEDHRLWRKIKAEYPEKASSMIFDDYVQRPLEVSRELLDFCNVPISGGLQRWLAFVTNRPSGKSQDSTTRNHKWMETFTPQQISDINSECQEFYRETDFEWPSISL